MTKQDTDKRRLLMEAKRLQRYYDLLIQQCDNWLSPQDTVQKEKIKKYVRKMDMD